MSFEKPMDPEVKNKEELARAVDKDNSDPAKLPDNEIRKTYKAPEQDESLVKLVRSSKSFDDVYEAIQKIGSFRNAWGDEIVPEELSNMIEKVRSGTIQYTELPTEYAIMGTVMQLMRRETASDESSVPDDPKMNAAAAELSLGEDGEISTVKYNDDGRLQRIAEEKREEEERRRRRYIANQQKMRRRKR